MHALLALSAPLALLIVATAVTSSHTDNFQIDPQVIFTTRPDYLSVTIDQGLCHHAASFDAKSPLLRAVSKHLGAEAPTTVRFGGTDGDHNAYLSAAQTSPFALDSCLLSDSFLLQLADWFASANFRFVFGLNALHRNRDNTWNSTNAQQLLEFFRANHVEISAYELSNEPDLYAKHLNISVRPEQLAHDFSLLRQQLLPSYPLYGCDVASDLNYMNDFARALSDQSTTVQALTWHHYYGNSALFNQSDFYSPKVLDSLLSKLSLASTIVMNLPSHERPALFLGETSSTYGGGTGNVSASFAAGFMWLDKLCLAPLFNVSLVARQTLYGSRYALVGSGAENDFWPNPDYFTSILFKRLVGTKTLTVHDWHTPLRTLRVYSFCSAHTPGAVTIIALNLRNVTASLTFSGVSSSHRAEYLLTSDPETIVSRSIFLNGTPLNVTLPHFDLPPLEPLLRSNDAPFHMPPLSYAFVELVNAKVPSCHTQ